jgi:hypothetical protein
MRVTVLLAASSSSEAACLLAALAPIRHAVAGVHRATLLERPHCHGATLRVQTLLATLLEHLLAGAAASVALHDRAPHPEPHMHRSHFRFHFSSASHYPSPMPVSYLSG